MKEEIKWIGLLLLAFVLITFVSYEIFAISWNWWHNEYYSHKVAMMINRIYVFGFVIILIGIIVGGQ